MTGRGLYSVEVNNNQLRVLLNVAQLNLNGVELNILGESVRDSAERVRARAVRNVSGYPVLYQGMKFVVRVRTGTLKGAVDKQWPYGNPLQARVFVNGAHTSMPVEQGGRLSKPMPVSQYAAAIEYGHEEIDLKKTMMGKTVPFFASRSANSTGPFSVRGLTPVDGSDDLFENKKLNQRLAHPLLGPGRQGPMHFQRRVAAAYSGASGGAGTYFISFRKVGKVGWIIPAARARPFMRAALMQSKRDTRRLTGAALVRIAEGRAK